MDAALFTKMLSDKSVLDLKKLGYNIRRRIWESLFRC